MNLEERGRKRSWYISGNTLVPAFDGREELNYIATDISGPGFELETKNAVTPLYISSEAEMTFVFTATSVHSNGGFIRNYGQTF